LAWGSRSFVASPKRTAFARNADGGGAEVGIELPLA
jgi:hypothetical protein